MYLKTWIFIGIYSVAGTGCKKGGSKSAEQPATVAGTLETVTPTEQVIESTPAGVLTSVDNLTVKAADADLTMPGSLNLVDTTDGGTTLQLSTDTDRYSIEAAKDRSRVAEESTEVLDFTNSLLCIFESLNYTAHVNGPSYKALIEESHCFDSSGDSFSEPKTMAINTQVSRAPESPLNVAGWFDFEMGDGGVTTRLHIQALIGEGASAANPFGIFRMMFAGYLNTDGVISPNVTIQGTVETGLTPEGKVRLLYSQNQSEGTDASIGVKSIAEIDVVNGALAGGKISTNSSQTQGSMSQTATYKVTYSPTHLLEHRGTKEAIAVALNVLATEKRVASIKNLIASNSEIDEVNFLTDSLREIESK